ncbi:MAG: MauE/DoxX family redox-associated membrane protein [Jatrophihabitantaceae bacterium]
MFSYVLMSIRCLLVLVLAAAAIGKLRHRSELADFGRTLRLGLGLPKARLVAGAWVAGEGLTALGLALPLTVDYAATTAVLVFGCLTAGAAVLVAQRRQFTCNCFGAGHSPLSWRTVLRNGALTGAGALLVAGLRSSAADASAPVVLAAVLTVLVGAFLVGQARPLRILFGQFSFHFLGNRHRPPRSALPVGGRR